MSLHTLPDFALVRPATLDQALAVLASGHTVRPIAGGTDLVPNLRHGLGAPTRLVDLSGLPGMSEIGVSANGALELGAGVTLARLASDPDLARNLPALAEAARAAAGPGHRSAATLGGNLCQDTRCIYYNQSAWWRQTNGYCLKLDGDTCHVAPQGKRCHAAFCSDLAPVLLAQGAEVELAVQPRDPPPCIVRPLPGRRCRASHAGAGRTPDPGAGSGTGPGPALRLPQGPGARCDGLPACRGRGHAGAA